MMKRLQDLTISNRRLLVVLVHLGLWTAAFGGAFLLRFDFAIPLHYWQVKYIAWLLPLAPSSRRKTNAASPALHVRA